MNKDLKEFFKLIGCSEFDDISKIKKAYRELIMEYHPDILQAEGIKGELLNLAKIQFSNLQSNYKMIVS